MALPDYSGYLYLVRLYSKDGKEQFHKIGVAARGAKARFAYGNQRIIDSNLPTLEKLRRVLINKGEYISETPYEVETIYEVQFKYIGDAYLAERDLLGAL